MTELLQMDEYAEQLASVLLEGVGDWEHLNRVEAVLVDQLIAAQVTAKSQPEAQAPPGPSVRHLLARWGA